MEKMFPAFQNIFSFEKKPFWMIQIVFGTIWITVRAKQKVISASPTTFCLGTCRAPSNPFAVAERVDLSKKRILQ
jgi:hypothetical protein